ncbi:MAG TPA: hypothetical protein GX708_07380 [Gallicola sp.]|nr:hypothetical protein [Gallicola sp.]
MNQDKKNTIIAIIILLIFAIVYVISDNYTRKNIKKCIEKHDKNYCYEKLG